MLYPIHTPEVVMATEIEMIQALAAISKDQKAKPLDLQGFVDGLGQGAAGDAAEKNAKAVQIYESINKDPLLFMPLPHNAVEDMAALQKLRQEQELHELKVQQMKDEHAAKMRSMVGQVGPVPTLAP